MSYQLGKAHLQTCTASLAFAVKSIPENVDHQGVMFMTGEQSVIAETVRAEPKMRH